MKKITYSNIDLKNNPIFNNLDLVFNNIKEMIKDKQPPVVSLVALKTKDPFKILISTILSARTKDEITMKAFKNLFSNVKEVYELAHLEIKTIENLIKPVGFYKNKARYIKDVSQILIEKYNGKVPNSLEDLMQLPGVGLKTATLVLIEAFDKNEICVDTHVHRISNRWQLVRTKTPEETYYELKRVLPKIYWKNYNFLLVAFGQSICRSKPLCYQCSIKELCPYYQKTFSKT